MALKLNGSILVFFCEPGYALIGSSEIYCDGRQWNGTIPYCRGGCSWLIPLQTDNVTFLSLNCHSSHTKRALVSSEVTIVQETSDTRSNDRSKQTAHDSWIISNADESTEKALQRFSYEKLGSLWYRITLFWSFWSDYDHVFDTIIQSYFPVLWFFFRKLKR